jgi:histidinol dehydrogenase
LILYSIIHMKIDLRILKTSDPGFEADFARLLDRSEVTDPTVEADVRAIVDDVRTRGDAALLDYTRKFDRNPAASISDLRIDGQRLKQAMTNIADEQVRALQTAAQRIRQFHERQLARSWRYTEDDGTVLGQLVVPLERVGLYVPGGLAAYPSSVLMNAVPAKVAGVRQLIMTVPAPDGVVNDMVLAAAAIAGVDQVFTVGGAQAVGALAYGTESVPRVDKIVGPGNIYVATAKRLVFGQVGIDMIAGPSEIVILCDGRTDADWVAMDLFSQAEHDENAQAILISLNADYTTRVAEAVNQLLGQMERQDVIRASLERRGALITARGLEEGIDLINRIAPEHLELSLDDALDVAERVRHAGAIFLGRHTAEVFGDYCAGPNHVLPTSGTARFSSPLGVYDFQKRSSLIMCSTQSADTLGRTASVLARGEGLTAHARSAEYRMKK